MKLAMNALLILGIIIGASLVQAAPEDQALMTPQEQEMRSKAKKRLYPGGKDEEPLKVQTQLPTVTRKMAPATDAPIEESAPDESEQ